MSLKVHTAGILGYSSRSAGSSYTVPSDSGSNKYFAVITLIIPDGYHGIYGVINEPGSFVVSDGTSISLQGDGTRAWIKLNNKANIINNELWSGLPSHTQVKIHYVVFTNT